MSVCVDDNDDVIVKIVTTKANNVVMVLDADRKIVFPLIVVELKGSVIGFECDNMMFDSLSSVFVRRGLSPLSG